MSYLSYRELSYLNSKRKIKKIEQEYKLIGTPDRYGMPDSLMLNAACHLNKSGLDLRATLYY